ncbi:unnamed protein product [Prunus armeniaca]
MDNRGNAIFSFMFDDDSDDEEEHQRVRQAILHHTSLKNEATKHGGSIVGREYKNREREDRHRNLMSDYFVERPHFNTTNFRRRWARSTRVSLEQSLTAGFRMLAWGCSADAIDDRVWTMVPYVSKSS